MTPLWRSLQYVPAHVDKYVSSPKIREADAVILDLQDSVPPDAKSWARSALPAAVQALAGQGPDLLVRINEDPDLAALDIATAVSADVEALVLPNVRTPADVLRIDALVGQREAALVLERRRTRLLVLVESAEGLTQLSAIARASSRITAINLGNEDLALDLGVSPTEEALSVARQLLVIAAAAAGVTPLGLVGSGTNFSDLDAYRALAERSRRLGSRGASCIHPSQIRILNEVFAPAPDELQWAERVVEAASEAARAGRGAFSLDGRMIDRPITARAEALLRQAEAVRTREARRAAMAT